MKRNGTASLGNEVCIFPRFKLLYLEGHYIGMSFIINFSNLNKLSKQTPKIHRQKHKWCQIKMKSDHVQVKSD